MEKRDLFMHLLTAFTVCTTICFRPMSQCALLGVCIFVVGEVSLKINVRE